MHEAGALADTALAEAGALADTVLAAPARLGGIRVVAIDGPSGAGKSTLASAVLRELRGRGVETALISTDAFATWDDPVSWWPRLVAVLDRLEAGEPGHYRAISWIDGKPEPGERVFVAVPHVLVLEGVSAARASVRPSLSVLCWLDGPSRAARLERAVARDGEPERVNLSRWQAFEQGWFTVDRPDRKATSWLHSFG